MHDKNGTPLKVGDNVILTGSITEITSDQPTYCNITVVSHEGMAPDQPGSAFSLSARMVIKGTLLPPEHIQEALRGAACHIRDLQRQLDDQRRIAHAREEVLQATIVRMSSRGYPQDTCGPMMAGSLSGHHVAGNLDRLAESMSGEAKAEPQDNAKDTATGWRDDIGRADQGKPTSEQA